MTEKEKKALPWQDRQAWECGFTPKCCACKYAKKETEFKGGKEIEVFRCYRKRKKDEQNFEYRKNGRVTKEWNGTCFGFVWKYAEGEQMELEGVET
jgi:hypothetical protein